MEMWPETAWCRLIAAVADPSAMWATMPRCAACGRNLAASDCEPDRGLCWSGVTGRCL
jgi:hypothetical protein